MANDFPITPGVAGAVGPVATDKVNARHYQVMKLASGAEDSETRILVPVAAGDAVPDPTVPQVLSHQMLWNGDISWHKQRGNVTAEVLASAARTATINSASQTNHNARGVTLLLNVTANPGGLATLTVSIETQLANVWRALTAFAATASGTNATYIYQLYPGIVETSAVGNVEVQGLGLPRFWRVTVTHSGAGSWTYSASSSLML